ncbi:HNH endonuclease signature motif containing protein [Pectobacterium polaris]|uniref:HNH endonuclease n=1 Tax=Pectobacterium polaris TaxID=2042057 RepID=UPI0023B0C599|nr:HNH endonuclease signature motif containing protein [Pectobacterium polaris]MDE8754184.1 HNH endonuclease signature motif containing protein [Pectobacterium polaris]
MNAFEEYLSKLPSKKGLSDVKYLILKKLWHSDEIGFPKPWISSAELLELTQQKYFDRRARELRDQFGCDVESKHIAEFSGHGWRLKSDEIAPPLDREYLTESQRSALFSSYHYSCATCGKKVAAGLRGLQADHKIPLSRGGGNELANWQPLCHNCNVGKRRACFECEQMCRSCSWAYPGDFGIPTIIHLNEQTLRKAEKLAADSGNTLNGIIDYAIRKL